MQLLGILKIQIKRGNPYEKILVWLLLIALSCTMLVTTVQAYVLKGWHVEPNLKFLPSRDFSSTTRSGFQSAAEKWNFAIGDTVLQISSATHLEDQYPNKEDDESLIYYVDDGEEYLAECTTYLQPTARDIVRSADININAYYDWTDGKAANKYDYQSVFTHELGHALGLGHTTYDDCVMFPTSSPNSTRRNLGDDDIAGIEAIYQ